MFLKRLSPRTFYTSPLLTHSNLVKVWWDVQSCPVPLGVNTYRVTQTIADAIKARGINGPIEIKAFGDLSKTNQWILTHTGVDYSAGLCLSTDLNHWVLDNPPAANIFLISEDVKLEEILCRLRKKRYNILLSNNSSSILNQYASTIWAWDDLVRGGNEKPTIRCDGSFWRDMQTFMSTEVASFIIAESSNREHMACLLHKYGPSVLRSLTKSDALLVVDKLILEKKWVVEAVELVKPFKRPHAGELEKQNAREGEKGD